MQLSSSTVAKSLLLEHSQSFASGTAAGCVCNQFQMQLCSFSLPCTGDNSAPWQLLQAAFRLLLSVCTL